jgi:hypothetical protein
MIPIEEAARLLMISRPRIYQLIAAGDLEKRGRGSLSTGSVLARMFEMDGDEIVYRPLGWRFRLHRPAPNTWPICGAKTYDGSLAVGSDRVPPELVREPELAARIANFALAFATR